MADGTSTLGALLWGTSTGGAAGAGESSLTLGVDRVDVRVPPDATRLWGLQLNQVKNLAQAMSVNFKGGTRLGCLTQTSSPFGVSEQGLWIDTSGNLFFSYGGIASPLLTGHQERGWSAMTSGSSGNTHDYLDVTLGTAFAAATGNNGYNVECQLSLTSNTAPGIVLEGIVNKITTGFRLVFSGDFDGEVRWRAF